MTDVRLSPNGAPEPQLDDLYRDVIVEHYRKPHNFHRIPAADVHSEGMNPLCGDEIALDLCFAGDRVTECAFSGNGCAISQASASMLTDAVTGRGIEDTEALIGAFEAMLTRGAPPAPQLGDLEALQGVAAFPVRIKCALLAWKVLRQALEEREDAED